MVSNQKTDLVAPIAIMVCPVPCCIELSQSQLKIPYRMAHELNNRDLFTNNN